MTIHSFIKKPIVSPPFQGGARGGSVRVITPPTLPLKRGGVHGARKNSHARKIAKAYSTSLSSLLTVHGAFLFGSAARHTMKKDSDIDLIILSRDFDGMPFLKRLQFLNRQRQGPALTVPMDILGFTPKEFQQFRTHASPNIRGIYHSARML